MCRPFAPGSVRTLRASIRSAFTLPSDVIRATFPSGVCTLKFSAVTVKDFFSPSSSNPTSTSPFFRFVTVADILSAAVLISDLNCAEVRACEGDQSSMSKGSSFAFGRTQTSRSF